MSKPRLAVVYVGDTACHLLSLFSTASVARSHRVALDFHLLRVGYDATIDPTFTRQINRYGHRLFTYRIAFTMPAIGSRVGAKEYLHISDAMFLKGAAIESLTGQYDFVLYLDSDTLAFDDLRLDTLVGFPEPVAAAVDMAAVIDTGNRRFRYESVDPHTFFNSGLMLVNAQEWRRREIYKRYLDALIQHQSKCPYFRICEPVDQCSLNMALTGCWRTLDPSLNTQRIVMHTRAWKQATIRHYTKDHKFLPMSLHRCDPREYDLLCDISQETKLPHPGAFYDGGLSFWLNGLRRFRDVGEVKRALANKALRQPPYGTATGTPRNWDPETNV